jgi:hypothetical protein
MCQYEGKVIRAALKQTLNITCDIDSNPMVSEERIFIMLMILNLYCGGKLFDRGDERKRGFSNVQRIMSF